MANILNLLNFQADTVKTEMPKFNKVKKNEQPISKDDNGKSFKDRLKDVSKKREEPKNDKKTKEVKTGEVKEKKGEDTSKLATVDKNTNKIENKNTFLALCAMLFLITSCAFSNASEICLDDSCIIGYEDSYGGVQPLLTQKLNKYYEYYKAGKSSDDILKRIVESMRVQQKVGHSNNFSDIFTNSRNMSSYEVVYVDDLVTNYLSLCCNNKEEAILLLEKSGFNEMQIKDKASEAEFFVQNRKQLNFDPNDTNYVSASRQSGIIGDTWVVRLYYKGKKLDRSSASIRSKPPL